METRITEHTGKILSVSYFNVRSNLSLVNFSLEKDCSNLFSLQREMHA
jgi:hypothetical protein